MKNPNSRINKSRGFCAYGAGLYLHDLLPSGKLVEANVFMSAVPRILTWKDGAK